MFTDMVGFTALAQQDEERAMRLLDEQRRIVRPIIGKHGGREVKTMGDAFLVEFASSLEAVNCAGEIQETVGGAKPAEPAKNISLRIGIHLGDVIHSGDDVAGDAVNVASRIEPLAPPGGICVSAQVRDSVLNKARYSFVSLGTPRLKNVSAHIEVYQISGFGPQLERVVPGNEKRRDRIAVLPFANISQDKDEEYFADGLTEELISSVSRTRGLRVIARTSVMKYKDTRKPVSEIGRELGVGNILEGSVRKAGNRVRISIQLVDPADEDLKWSQQYDREISDIFEIQSDISNRVAEALRLQILGAQGARTHTSNPEAYVYHLRGRQSWNTRTEAGIRQAIGFFQKALAADDAFARAYAGLADCYSTLALLEFVPPNEAYPKAKEAVGRALSLDPTLAEAHTSLGLIRFQYDWDWKGAEEEFNEALRINPSYAPAHHFFADYLKAMGRFDEALAEIEKAQELDPLNLAINTGVGHVLYLSKQYDRSIQQYKKAVDLDPNFALTHIWFGRPYLEKGMYPEAIAELETAVKLSGEGTLALAMLGHGLASGGRTDDARKILEQLMGRSKTRYVPSYWIAVVYNGFKDREQVLKWLRRAHEERSSWLVWCNVEPRFDWIRNDSEFSSLMAEMKFP
jgi:TolB-like protein/Tfp pilus assembly protein PilF